MRARSVLTALLALLVVAPPARAADAQIEANPNAPSFSPSEVTVFPGDIVTVTRLDGGSLAHNVHYEDEVSACPGPPTTTAWNCLRSFSSPGNYTFRCDLHLMQATVHVVDPSEPPADPPPPTLPPTQPTFPLGSNAPAPARPSFAGTPTSIQVNSRGKFKLGFRATPGLKGVALLGTAGKVRVSAKRKQRLTLAGRHFTVPAGGKVSLTVKLSQVNLTILQRNTRLSTRATVTLESTTGLTSTASKAITLRAPRP